MIPLRYEALRVIKCIEVEWWLSGAREGNGELLFNGYGVSLGEGEKVLETDGSGGCPTMWMFLMPLNRLYNKKWLKW